MNTYHILNGDALLEQFPVEIEGERIVARECLVDGDVQGETIETFFENRAQFISTFYGDYSLEDYQRDTVSEFEKMQKIPAQSTICLWFEDDLFCQVNLWFVTYLLHHHVKDPTVSLIRPHTHTPYGFGGLRQPELVQLYRDQTPLPTLQSFARLWELYRQNDLNELLNRARELDTTFPFVLPAVEAHISRIPSDTHPGRPAQTLQQIMDELDTTAFGPIFREFCKREPMYGFGDLQVKKLVDELRANK